MNNIRISKNTVINTDTTNYVVFSHDTDKITKLYISNNNEVAVDNSLLPDVSDTIYVDSIYIKYPDKGILLLSSANDTIIKYKDNVIGKMVYIVNREQFINILDLFSLR